MGISSDPDYFKKRYAANTNGYRDAMKVRAKAWYEANKEKVLARRKERWETDAEFRTADNAYKKKRSKERWRTDPAYRAKMGVRRREQYVKNADARRKYSRDYWAKHKDCPAFKEKQKEQSKIQRVRHAEKYKARALIWTKNNPEKVSARQMRYNRKKLATPEGAIHARMSRGVRHSLNILGIKKDGQTWPKFLGYTASQLKMNLESKFTDGMTWSALLRGEIEIDHIIPKSKFKFSSVNDIEFRRCWAMENLQPLWMSDNARKKDKILAPAQIALGL